MQIEDRRLQALRANIAELTGRTVEEAAALIKDDLVDLTARLSFQTLGLQIANRFAEDPDFHLMEDGPRAQAGRAAKALERLHERVPLWPTTLQDVTADLFGFGRAPIHYVTQADEEDGHQTRYFLLSELAEQLGIPLAKAHEWAKEEAADALRAQREVDEKNGTLGWACMNDVVDLHLWLTVNDAEATPNADGNHWGHAGEWLVSDDRLLSLMTASPWYSEFLTNAMPLMAHAMVRSTLADKVDNVLTYVTVETYDGETRTGPTGDTLGDRIREDAAQMSAEEAAERAMRGLDLGGA